MAEVEVEFTFKKPKKGTPKPSSSSRKSSLVASETDTVQPSPNSSAPKNKLRILNATVTVSTEVEESTNKSSNNGVVAVDSTVDDPKLQRQSSPVENDPSREQKQQLSAPVKRDIALLNEIDDSKLLELEEAFLLFDLNQDGIIDKEDLILTFKTLGQTDINETDVQKMLAEAPSPLDFDSFVMLLGYKTIELDSEETLIAALSQWDYDNSGFISEEQIRHDLMHFGDRFSKKEVDVALEDAPVYINKGKAMIDYIKFCKALCGLRKNAKIAASPRAV